MPFEIKWEKEGVCFRFYGKFDYQANEDANRKLYGDSKVNYIKYIIWDTTAIDEAILTEEEIDMLAIDDIVGTSYLPNIKFALIGTNKKLLKLFEYYTDKSNEQKSPWRFKVFSQQEDAKVWLNS